MDDSSFSAAAKMPGARRLRLPAGRGGDFGGMQGTPTADPRQIPQPQPQNFVLTSESFQNGGIIPDHLAGEEGVSPHLAWANVPRGTARFVIIMDDPDAQPAVGHTFVHWVAALPDRTRSLDEGASGGGWTDNPRPLAGDATSTPYRGPRPPSGAHRYFIKVYAMGSSFGAPDFRDLARNEVANDTRTYTRQRFEELFRSDILSMAEISGTYSAEPHVGV